MEIGSSLAYRGPNYMCNMRPMIKKHTELIRVPCSVSSNSSLIYGTV
jgi:hypothetical protein